MSKYLGLFVAEATEHLEALARDLVRLEKDRGASELESMFRHAHSVKGMAASMGLEATATLAHRLEDLFDAVRAEPKHLDRSLVDLLLSATDALTGHVKAVAEARPLDDVAAVEKLLTERVTVLTGKAPPQTRVAQVTAALVPAPQSPPPAAPATPSSSGLGLPPRFVVKVRVAANCAVPGVRGFLVHKKLAGLGNVFDLKPSIEDVKAGRIPDGLISLELETSSDEAAIQATLKNISEVELVHLAPVSYTAPPLPAPSAPKEPTSNVVGQESGRTVRVRTELLDYFLDTVGELLLATARIREAARAGQPAALDETVDRLHGLVKDLHDKIMKARMTPLSLITDRLPRTVRDIARRRERDVELVITGADVELDRSIIDELADPLLHVLRNCVDHGIESPAERTAAKKPAQGRVQVSVRRVKDRVHVEIEDDGRGMDADKLRSSAVARGLMTPEAAARLSDREAFMLCCLPGVSTAKDVSEISGRGVGMDAVKRVVENVGGALEIESEKGKGTRFVLRLPLTVAVVNLLLVEVGDEIVGLPINKVLGVVESAPESLSKSRQTALLPYGPALLPVYELASLLAVPGKPQGAQQQFVVMEGDSGKVALSVDRLRGQEEVVLKALVRPLDLVSGLSGVTILGSGRPVFILDVPRLLAA